MAEDIVGGVRKLIQDLLAPELQEIKGRLAGLETRIAAAEIAVTARIEAVEKVFNTRLDSLKFGFDVVDMKQNIQNEKLKLMDQKLDLLLNQKSLEARVGSVEQVLAQVQKKEAPIKEVLIDEKTLEKRVQQVKKTLTDEKTLEKLPPERSERPKKESHE